MMSLQMIDIQDAESDEKLDDPSQLPSLVNASHPRNSDDSNELLRRRSGLPSTSVHCRFEWRGLNSFIGLGEKRKQILFENFGAVQSGELLAVMGGSGAGKSTLLNLLSGRTNTAQQDIEGEIAVNGEKFDANAQNVIKAICSFIPQSDILCATQTVEEALMFYAALRLSHKSPELQRKRVDYLIEVLNLEKCRDSYIGDEKKRGISGGEKRRVSIAAEILNDVDIIFLDEPTSGLDAYTAARTIKTLKQFCTVSNKIIIATIHQPSIEVFYLFDRLILLSHGQCCFNAATTDVNDYFRQQLRPRTNPADVIVFEVQRNSEEYVDKWSNSKLNQLGVASVNKWDAYQRISMQNIQSGQLNIRANTHMSSRLTQYRWLLKREITAVIRTPREVAMRFFQTVFFAVCVGFIYFHIEDDYGEHIRCAFVLTFIPLLFGLVSTLTMFPKQKLLFQREWNSGCYDTVTWTVSSMLLEVPRTFFYMIIFTLISYHLIGLNGHFWYYWITLFLTAFSGGSFGILFGTMCKSIVEAVQIVPIAVIPFIIFSDGVIEIASMPAAIKWMAYCDPLYYLMRCFYIIEFAGVAYPKTFSTAGKTVCDSYVSVGDDLSDYIVSVAEVNGCNTDVLSDINGTITLAKPKLNEFCSATLPASYFFDSKHLKPNELGKYWLMIFAICIGIRVLAIIALLLISNNGISLIRKWMRKLWCCCPCCRSRVNKDDGKGVELQGIIDVDQ